MTIASMTLDPNAQSYTDNQIIDKINAASTNISRASSVTAAARPLNTGEAKSNLDVMADVDRGYIKTNPTTTMFKIIALERQADGKMKVEYDDVPV